MKWLWRNIQLFTNWWSVYLGGLTLHLRDGFTVTLPSKHDIPIVWEIIGEKCYGAFTGREKCIVDIGANIGVYSAYALAHTNATVYSYEPVSSNFALLKKNAPRAIAKRRALAPQRGTVKIHLSESGDSGHASLIKGIVHSNKYEEVEAVTLDDIINEIGDIDILKIDIEGMEPDVLTSCAQRDRIKRIECEAYYRHL